MHRFVKYGTLLCVAWLAFEAAGAGLGAARRIFAEAVPLQKAAKSVYRTISDIVEPAKVEFPASEGQEFIKSSLRAGVDAVATRGAAAAAEGVGLRVNPDVDGADVKIMNIAPAYKEGMRLPPGDYEIQVTKENYRSQRFWTRIAPDAAGGEVEVSVAMKELGLPGCKNNIELSNYGNVMSSTGVVLQAQGTFEESNINDLYLSFSKNIENANFLYVLDKVAHPNYVEFRFVQSTQLSKDEIGSNAKVGIDPERFVLHKAMFEANGNNVTFTYQAFVPQGALTMAFNEQWVCDNVFNF